MTIRVVIADDHAIVRSAIEALLNNILDLEVVAQAGNGSEALKLVDELNPDILLLDLSMPGLSGEDVLSHIKKENPEVKVIVLSMFDGPEYIRSALSHGAAGYLVKKGLPEELRYAIQAVKNGLYWISPEIANTVVSGYLAPDHPHLLSARQIEVIRMLAEGRNVKQISDCLNITIKTAEAHRNQIMHKLNINSLAGLVRYAAKHKIIDL